MQALAVAYSIPTAFFAWGLITFFIAIAWLCLHDTSSVTRIIVCIAIAVSAFFLAWITQWQAKNLLIPL
ncbi:hypothetical protein BD309DRAFT_1024680 [Dichomitus squalens]|nr:hypothetical protein BD309DRAFT_1024680 [Dichomitus squalens]